MLKEMQDLCNKVAIIDKGTLIETGEISDLVNRYLIDNQLGLNLHISKTIIQSMKGNIQAKITLDIITFEVTIPIYNIKEPLK